MNEYISKFELLKHLLKLSCMKCTHQSLSEDGMCVSELPCEDPAFTWVELDQIIYDFQNCNNVVAVVRCRDCVYAHMTADGLCKYCDVLALEGLDDSVYFDGNHYCSDGVRKD